ncbi:HAD-like protein [Mycena albidolilacea]|uniref:HAD-like protein n=1 Tax=Mycena albidolilacea TaxID=1033008 RepID=A0AAD6ZGC7_9AGAR|nr:HAD-like protein [Mycena albidolilacea]
MSNPSSCTSTPMPSFNPHRVSAATSPAHAINEKDLLAPIDLAPHIPRRQCDNVIFDIGDVLFTWSAETKTTISGSTLRKILRSATWFEYEKGNLGEAECYELVAREFKIQASEVAAAFQGARDSLTASPEMTALLHELKKSGARMYAMSNISAPDWEVLRHKGKREDWDLFEDVFTSAAAHERKPNLGYFRQVLSATGIDPERTAFVDDKLENVLTARSLGLKGIVFSKFEEVERQLKAMFRDPIAAAEQWLKLNAKQMKSETNTGVVLEENFAQLLILEATGDPSLVDYIEYPRLSNFFKDGGVLTTASFPYDQDTSSIALSVAPHFDEATKQSVMDEILTYRNQDKIATTYFDRGRPRIDPIVGTNVMTFFHINGRGEELSDTLDWVYDVLKHQAYADGTLYYYGPDPFFYFLSRLIAVSPAVRERFGPLFVSRITKLFGSAGDALALSMRIIAAAVVGLCDTVDHERLLSMQEVDGSWPVGWVYKYGAVDILIGNKGLTTALGMRALREVETLRADSSYGIL